MISGGQLLTAETTKQTNPQFKVYFTHYYSESPVSYSCAGCNFRSLRLMQVEYAIGTS